MSHYTQALGIDLNELPEEFFISMKNSIASLISLEIEDPRDFTLFYGLWWKFAYTEGKPSKEMLFNDLGIDSNYFTAADLYEKAKKGGEQIGLRWIRRENTLRFRTLLLQGGIPLKTLGNYGTQIYKNFLLKVIEIRPDSTEEISNNFDLIKYLPISNRNEVFFEIALKISKAIWEENEEGLKILKILETNQQENLVNELRTRKVQIGKNLNLQIKVKTFWELTKSALGEDYIVELKVDLPERMMKDQFADFLQIVENDLKSFYNFFCDETLLATYKKNINGNFLKVSSFKSALKWDTNSDQIPILYFSDDSGKKSLIPQQISKIPNIEGPSFWIQMEENRWIMSLKLNHHFDSIFVLSSKINHCAAPFTTINIFKEVFYFFEINETTSFRINENEVIEFRLKTHSFDWYIRSAMPAWMEKANMIVVRSLPQVHFYKENGDLIVENLIDKSWRLKGEVVWNSFQKPISEGIIELKFTHSSGSIEYEKVFNIGNADLQITDVKLLSQLVKFKHVSLIFEILHNDLFENTSSSLNNNEIQLKFTNIQKIPNRIKSIIFSKNGKLSFVFAIKTNGVELYDSQEKPVENNHIFLLNNLFGNRIICGENKVAKIYNQQYPELVIHQNMQAGIIPLRNFNHIFQKLFLLADSMSTSNVVILEIEDKSYNFQIYNSEISFKSSEGNIYITSDNRLLIKCTNHWNDEIRISAIPLNCDLNSISEIILEKEGDGLSFPRGIKEDEFIVFDSNAESSVKILPTYVTSNNVKLELDKNKLYENKLNRINFFAENLSEQSILGNDWSKLYSYIQLCLRLKLPFSAFDIIRAACSSTELTAKLLCSIIRNSTDKEDFIRTCEKMEDELGFKFHWCSFDSIDIAINWMIDAIGVGKLHFILEMILCIMRPKYFKINHSDWGKTLKPIKPSINNMRMLLGETVINELPKNCPWISEQRKYIITLDEPNISNRLKIMFRVPIIVALLKLNNYKSELPAREHIYDLWHLNNHEVRRNMIYCENLDPDWYDFAVSYAKQRI